MFTLDICRWALNQQRLGGPHESENKCCLLQMCNACDWSCLTPLNSPPTHLSINTHGFKSGGCRGATSVWLWFTQMKEWLKGRKTFRDTGHKVAGSLQCWTHWIKHWCVTLRSNWWPRLRAEGRVTQPFFSFCLFPDLIKHTSTSSHEGIRLFLWGVGVTVAVLTALASPLFCALNQSCYARLCPPSSYRLDTPTPTPPPPLPTHTLPAAHEHTDCISSCLTIYAST